MKVFGFSSSDGGNTYDFAPLPDGIEAESTSLRGGQSMTDANGDTYTTSPADDDK
ncbi:hypothetical protein AB0K74_25460 [Streptomyces sp. NPDC056159]|uniref:hypothetical protein n=1 Tax=unclassified Streptomyces TaxID=2593676 RepID=UPI0034152383